MAGEADRRGSPVIPRSTLLVRRLAPSAAGLRTYARGRVCAAESCATVLSVYNGAAFCALHDCVMASRRAAPCTLPANGPAITAVRSSRL